MKYDSNTNHVLILLMLFTVAFVVTGCGDDEPKPTPSTPTPSTPTPSTPAPSTPAPSTPPPSTPPPSTPPPSTPPPSTPPPSTPSTTPAPECSEGQVKDQDGVCKPSCQGVANTIGATEVQRPGVDSTRCPNGFDEIAPGRIHDEEAGRCCIRTGTQACVPATWQREGGICKPSCAEAVRSDGIGQVARGSECDDTSNFEVTLIPGARIYDEEIGKCCGKRCLGLGLESIVTGVNSRHSCGIVGEHKNIQCWGDNTRGQVGNNCQAGSRNNKQRISYVVNASSTASCLQTNEVPVNDRLINAKKVALGVNHTCALLEGNEMCCWGQNDLRQIGKADFTAARSLKPVVLDIPKNNRDITENVQDIVAGDNHSCILTQTGRVYCWGDNSKGQSGFGSPDGISKRGELSANTLFWDYNSPYANFAACSGTGAGDCLRVDQPREIAKHLTKNITTNLEADNAPIGSVACYTISTKRSTDIATNIIVREICVGTPTDGNPASCDSLTDSSACTGEDGCEWTTFGSSPDCSSENYKVPRCNTSGEVKCATLTGADLVKELNARFEAEKVVSGYTEDANGDHQATSCASGTTPPSDSCDPTVDVAFGSTSKLGFSCNTRYCGADELVERDFFIDSNNRKFWTKPEHQNGIWPSVPPNFPCEKLYDTSFMTSLNVCRDKCAGSWDGCPKYASASGTCPTPTITTDTCGPNSNVACTCIKQEKDAQACLSLQSQYRVVFGCSHTLVNGDVNQVCKDFIETHQEECNVEKKKWEDLDTVYRRLNGTIDRQRTRYAQISAGANHTCATTVTGDVHCWGDNSKNQLGAVVLTHEGSATPLDTTDDNLDNPAATAYCETETDSQTSAVALTFSAIPQVVKDPQNKNGKARQTMSDVVEVALGADFSCGMIRDGDSNKLKCWGDTSKGVRGNNTAKMIIAQTSSGTGNDALDDDEFCFPNVDVPSSIRQCSGTSTEASPNISNRSELPDVTDVLAGRQHICARRICLDGKEEVLCWGDDSQSQIGRVISSSTSNASDIALPVIVSETGSAATSLVGVTNLFVNKDLSCGVQRVNASDKVVCWGTYINPLGGNEDDITVNPRTEINQCIDRTSNTSAGFLGWIQRFIGIGR